MMNQSSDAPAIPVSLMSAEERAQARVNAGAQPTPVDTEWEDLGNALDQVKDVLHVSAKFYPVAVLQEAYTLYLHSAASPEDIAVKLNVPKGAVARWISAGDWATRKRDIENTLMAEAEAKYRQFLVDNRLPEAQLHLELARKLQAAFAKTVDVSTLDDATLNPVSLERLAKALAAMTGVSARAVGISESSALDNQAAADRRRLEQENSKPPLFIIGVSGGALIQVPPGAQPAGKLGTPTGAAPVPSLPE